jgi:hypothetical protein
VSPGGGKPILTLSSTQLLISVPVLVDHPVFSTDMLPKQPEEKAWIKTGDLPIAVNIDLGVITTQSHKTVEWNLERKLGWSGGGEEDEIK